MNFLIEIEDDDVCLIFLSFNFAFTNDLISLIDEERDTDKWCCVNMKCSTKQHSCRAVRNDVYLHFLFLLNRHRHSPINKLQNIPGNVYNVRRASCIMACDLSPIVIICSSVQPFHHNMGY